MRPARHALVVALAWLLAAASGDVATAEPARLGRLADGHRVEASRPLDPDAEAPTLAAIARRDASVAKNAAALNPTGALRRVIYPMGLVDVAAAFQLFEGPRGGATDLLIVDSGLGRLGTSGAIRTAHASREGKAAHLGKLVERDYMHNGLPYQEQAAGARLLWELERLGAEDVVVTALAPDGAPRARGAAPRTADDPSEVRFTWRGRARRVVLVPGSLRPDALPPAVGRFLADGVDAVFEKASGPSLMSEPDLQRFVQTVVRRLHPAHGVVVTDDPSWADAADLGLVPLARRGTLPRRFGYLAYRAEAPRDAWERAHGRPPVPKNPILAATPSGGARSRLAAGRRALEARTAAAARTPGADAIPELEAIAGLRRKGGLGREQILLDLFDDAAREHRVSTDLRRAARPLLARLAAPEALPDPPGERAGMTSYNLDATLLDAIAALSPRGAVRDVVRVALVRARRPDERTLSGDQLTSFLRALGGRDGAPLDDVLDAIDAVERARGVPRSERADLLRHLEEPLREAIASTNRNLRALKRPIPVEGRSETLMTFDLEDLPREELRAMGRAHATAWTAATREDPRAERLRGRHVHASFAPFPLPPATGARSTSSPASPRPTGRGPRR